MLKKDHETFEKCVFTVIAQLQISKLIVLSFFIASLEPNKSSQCKLISENKITELMLLK